MDPRAPTSPPSTGATLGAESALRIGTLELRLRTMSERGTMSIKKSNRSERAIALAMSERWMVRRLFSSATMNARQVRSEMKTGSASNHLLSQAREKRMGASAEIIWT